MLSKCANPSCSASFRYFHQGKLFRVETSLTANFTTSLGDGSVENINASRSKARVEFFWLCDRCAPEMTLEHDGRGHVTVTPVVRGYQEAS
jgi:hypothetical protein